jgi:hypothetical protein
MERERLVSCGIIAATDKISRQAAAMQRRDRAEIKIITRQLRVDRVNTE